MLSQEEYKQRAFLNTLLNNMPLGIFVKNVKDDYRMVLVNRKAEELFVVDASEMIGKTDYDSWPKEEADFFRQTDEKVMQGKELVEINAEQVTTPRGTFTAHTLKVPIYDKDGEPSVLLDIIEDVTEKIHAQEELRQAKENAEEASRAKSDFLANMSHEIRTPMNAVLGMSSLLMDTKLNGEQKEWVNAINISGESLLNIINDIIDISKIEAGKLNLEKIDFDLFDQLQEVASIYAYQARDKRLEMLFKIDDNLPRIFCGDPVRIKQVFSNLISNAIKFTSEGHIVVALAQKAIEGDVIDIECRVEDTGIGIPMDKQKTVFQKFSQAEESTTRKFGGTGLGLTIVSELIAMMGGDIDVESKEGKGSTFIFNMHLQIGSGKGHREIDEDLAALKALIVDDYELTRDMLKTILERHGIHCESSASAEEALERLRGGNDFHFCMIDYSISGMDDLSFVDKLRSNKAYDDMVLIMVSGAMENKPYDELKKRGLQGFLKKPFRSDHIIGVIKLTMHNYRQGKDEPLVTGHTVTAVLDDKRAKHTRDQRQYSDKTLLVVEDIKMNMMLIKKVLSKFGVQLDTAVNGLEACEKVADQKYDLIFMDCQMPEMDGFEATRRIRAMEEKAGFRNVPIVALTADAMVGDREKCIAMGMNDYVNKPFKEGDIAKMLEKWLVEQDAA